jgi:hypothetical protein
MVNKAKRKRRFQKLVARRRKDRLNRAWRNLFVKKGILK